MEAGESSGHWLQEQGEVVEERNHHHRGAAAEARQLFRRGAEVEAAIQEHPWHHLAEGAAGEPFRQAVEEEVDQFFHPGEAAVEE